MCDYITDVSLNVADHSIGNITPSCAWLHAMQGVMLECPVNQVGYSKNSACGPLSNQDQVASI